MFGFYLDGFVFVLYVHGWFDFGLYMVGLIWFSFECFFCLYIDTFGTLFKPVTARSNANPRLLSYIAK